MPSEINPLGTTGGVKQYTGKNRFGSDATNPDLTATYLEPGFNY